MAGGSCTDTMRLQEHDGNLAERLNDCKHLLIALLLQQLLWGNLAPSGMLSSPARFLPGLQDLEMQLWAGFQRKALDLYKIAPYPTAPYCPERKCPTERKKQAGDFQGKKGKDFFSRYCLSTPSFLGHNGCSLQSMVQWLPGAWLKWTSFNSRARYICHAVQKNQ